MDIGRRSSALVKWLYIFLENTLHTKKNDEMILGHMVVATVKSYSKMKNLEKEIYNHFAET